MEAFDPASDTLPINHVGLYFEGAGSAVFTIGGGSAITIAVGAGSYLWGTFDSVTSWTPTTTGDLMFTVKGSHSALGMHPHERVRVRSTIHDYVEETLAANTAVSFPDGTIGVFVAAAGDYVFTYKGGTSRTIDAAVGQIIWGEISSIQTALTSNPKVYGLVSDRLVLRPTSIRG